MCGLFGFIGYGQQPLDKLALLALGCNNDSRGGDSCGLFIDGEVEYGVDQTKLFTNFYQQSILLQQTQKAEVVLGHCRKASVGKVNLDSAQPVVITNDDGEVDFVMIHNGTILNYGELADKYLTEVDPNLTDSQIMAWIVYFHGTQVLSEYLGAGMFIWVDYRTPNRKPSVFCFKGASPTSAYVTTMLEERPLYYVCTEQGLWFSSLSPILKMIAYLNHTECIDLPTNQVLLLNHQPGILGQLETYDRTKLFQKSTMYNNGYKTITHTPTSSSTSSQTSLTNSPSFYGYPYDEEDWDSYYEQLNTQSNPAQTTAINLPVATTKPTIDLKNVTVDGKIEFRGMRYYLGANLAHGCYILDDQGNIDYKTGHIFYFYAGILVYGKTIYEILTYIQEEFFSTSPTNFVNLCQQATFMCSQQPYFDQQDRLYKYAYGNQSIPCDGLFVPLFANSQIFAYKFKQGKITKTISNKLPARNARKAYYHAVRKYAQEDQRELLEKIFNLC